jgi:serine protease Do
MATLVDRARFRVRRFAAAGLAASVLMAWSGSALALGEAARGEPTAGAAQEEMIFARGLSRAFKGVASRVEPSVVHITQLSRVRNVRRDFWGMPVAVGEPQLAETGLGSGVIVSQDGLILTNNHVVRQAEELKVKLSDGREYPAKIVGRDELTDVAVLRIEADGLAPASFADSDQLEVGEWVVAIGSPFGFSNTVTAGIVSAKGRTGLGLAAQGDDGRPQQIFQDFIQTDAAINPGNSGGPLLNLDGKIVGVNTAIASRTGGYQGLGFAIPSNMARAVMDSIVKNGRVTRGWLGVQLADLSPEQSRELGVGNRPAVRVGFVLPESPAAKAGIREGDVITRFQGKVVDQTARLRTNIALTPPGTEAAIEVLREGKPVTIRASVGDLSAASGVAVTVPRLGMSVRTLSAVDARAMGYRGVQGVIVTGVEPGGVAARSGVQAGDILRAMILPDGGEATLDSAEDLARLAQQSDFRQAVEFQAIRGNRRGYITIQE